MRISDPSTSVASLIANDPGSLLTFLTNTEKVKIQRQPDGTRIIQSSNSF